MTTKPKARKFRIKRPSPELGTAAAELAAQRAEAARQAQVTQAASATQTTQSAGAPQAPQASQASSAPATTSAAKPAAQPAAQPAPSTSLDAIRKEGLTGRQLRMARRVAQKNGLAPTSDFDAVRLLRQRGIDPFQRSNILQIVAPDAAGAAMKQAALPKPEAGQKQAIGQIQLPQTVAQPNEPGVNLPALDTMSPAERRAREISEIQRDLAARRRRKMALLLTRLSFFVFLPTIIAAYYFFVMATPMYSTRAEFLIQQNEGGGGGAASLLAGTQFATSDESISVQGFLQSKEAMLRLDEDQGFKAHFQQDWIDPIQRLDETATNENAYKTYKKNVKIGFDPTEGVIRMEVIAADPNVSAEFSRRLIAYAEDRVNGLSSQRREDQMRDARQAFEEAEAERRAAQEALVRLQLETSTIDPEGVIASFRQQISSVEVNLIEKELELQALLDNARPNAARVAGVEGEIRRLNAQLDRLNERMTEATSGAASLAQRAVNIQMAQADLATRDLMLQSALQQMEQARSEALRQVRYLTVSVQPIASEEPSYPRAFENTILAFLIFAGIYLMISLTASILREQVSS